MNRHQRRQAEKLAGIEKKNPEAQVMIAIPSGPFWHAEFAMGVTLMMLDTMIYDTPGWGNITVSLKNIRGSIIWKQRTDLIQAAIKEGNTHLLFIDTDQVAPANTIRRLIHHKKPIVACNVAIKQVPTMPTARKLNDGQMEPVFTTAESRGLEEVYRIGTGVMLIDLAIMKDVPMPWFKVSWDKEGGEQYGEDWWFCMQLEKQGIPIYIDHDLSWEIGHIGQLTYKHEHVDPQLIAETQDILANGTPEEKAKLMHTALRRLDEADADRVDELRGRGDFANDETAETLTEQNDAKI